MTDNQPRIYSMTEYSSRRHVRILHRINNHSATKFGLYWAHKNFPHISNTPNLLDFIGVSTDLKFKYIYITKNQLSSDVCREGKELPKSSDSACFHRIKHKLNHVETKHLIMLLYVLHVKVIIKTECTLNIVNKLLQIVGR